MNIADICGKTRRALLCLTAAGLCSACGSEFTASAQELRPIASADQLPQNPQPTPESEQRTSGSDQSPVNAAESHVPVIRFAEISPARQPHRDGSPSQNIDHSGSLPPIVPASELDPAGQNSDDPGLREHGPTRTSEGGAKYSPTLFKAQSVTGIPDLFQQATLPASSVKRSPYQTQTSPGVSSGIASTVGATQASGLDSDGVSRDQSQRIPVAFSPEASSASQLPPAPMYAAGAQAAPANDEPTLAKGPEKDSPEKDSPAKGNSDKDSLGKDSLGKDSLGKDQAAFPARNQSQSAVKRPATGHQLPPVVKRHAGVQLASRPQDYAIPTPGVVPGGNLSQETGELDVMDQQMEAQGWQRGEQPQDASVKPAPRMPYHPRTGLFLQGNGYSPENLPADYAGLTPQGTDYFANQGYSDPANNTPWYATGDQGLSDAHGIDGCQNLYTCTGFMYDSCSYFIGEALYWERDGGEIIGGTFVRLDDFDQQWGGRFTYGRRVDEMIGWEISYLGFDSFLAESVQRDTNGNLLGILMNTDNVVFPAFANATFLDQVQKSQLQSVEWNRVWWGWDVAKLYYGARFLHFGDDLRISSVNSVGQRGLYQMKLDNNLFGAHIGGELFYDVGYRLSFSFRGKAGLFANFSEGDTTLFNAGVPIVANGDDDTDFAFAGELGVTAHYQLLPRLRAVASYDVLHLEEVATIENNHSPIISFTSGRNFSDGGDATFHGFGFGIEWYR